MGYSEGAKFTDPANSGLRYVLRAAALTIIRAIHAFTVRLAAERQLTQLARMVPEKMPRRLLFRVVCERNCAQGALRW